MKQIEISQLRKMDVTVTDISGLRQDWRDGEKYSFFRYPREESGFLLLRCKRAVYTLPNREKLIAEKNSVLYMPKGSRYLVRFEQDEEPVYPSSVVLRFTLFDEEKNLLLFGEKPAIWAIDENGMFCNLFLRVVDDYLAGNRLSLQCDFLTLLSELVQELVGGSNPLQPILDYIVNDLNDLPTIEKLAQKFAMSESTPSSQFYADYASFSLAVYPRGKNREGEAYAGVSRKLDR